MLLQAFSELIKDMARALGHDIAEVKNMSDIALFMFASMMLMLLSGSVFSVPLQRLQRSPYGGTGGQDIPFSAALKLMKWYPSHGRR